LKQLSSLFARLPNSTHKPVRKAVFTFIIGNYDHLKTPAVISQGWDYICFTDNPGLTSSVWDVRLTTREGEDRTLEDKKFAMKHMILAHQYLPGYDLTLSLGGMLQINCDLNGFIDRNFQEVDDMMVCKHPVRDCIYDEGETCKQIGKDDPQRIDTHMQRYRDEGYPRHNGLYSTGIMGMRHDRPNLHAMCELWWQELKRGSRRDQLSLNYAIWKSPPIKVSELNFEKIYRVDCNFLINAHLKKTA
jgi:hypothetical protein